MGALGTIVSNLSVSTSHPLEVLNVVESNSIFSNAFGASTAGAANTGGGGGGGGNSGGGSNGGSGVVILRYPDSKTITIGAGLSGSTNTSGGYKITTITTGTGNVSWA